MKNQEQKVPVKRGSHKILGQVIDENIKHTKREFMSPDGILLLKVNNENTRAMCKICLKLPIKTHIFL